MATKDVVIRFWVTFDFTVEANGYSTDSSEDYCGADYDGLAADFAGDRSPLP